ncbi:hypothetical protein PMAYCL1PPCAC_22293, partial [Pristionchus mayeri]
MPRSSTGMERNLTSFSLGWVLPMESPTMLTSTNYRFPKCIQGDCMRTISPRTRSRLLYRRKSICTPSAITCSWQLMDPYIADAIPSPSRRPSRSVIVMVRQPHHHRYFEHNSTVTTRLQNFLSPTQTMARKYQDRLWSSFTTTRCSSVQYARDCYTARSATTL